jgi:hypothetical protein
MCDLLIVYEEQMTGKKKQFALLIKISLMPSGNICHV